MDIEFHYYMTYLVAAKAGFGPDDAFKIAFASQYVDNNDVIFEVDKGKPTAFRNYISQTMNILKPKPKLFRIYPVFHFIPGDPQNSTAWRKDGKMHWLNTTPDCENANLIMDAALSSQDPYRIGIACHGYADTWAHQNFVGFYESFNAMDDLLSKLTPNIGHADAQHNPDWPALVWKDKRLIQERIDNKARFLGAAEKMLEKLTKYVDSKVSKKGLNEKTTELIKDMSSAIGEMDQTNDYVKERVGRYKELSARSSYSDQEVEEYDDGKWFEECVNENVRGLRDRSDIFLTRWDPLTDVYTWKDRQQFKLSNWYCFQKAVKQHQEEALDILSKTNLKGLEQPHLFNW